MDSSGNYGEAYYRRVIKFLDDYFACDDWERLFLKGGCYWLSEILHRGIRNSEIMVNRIEEHCALAFGSGLYDVTGRISAKDFHRASAREICFMKKNYVPRFDTRTLEQYLTDKFRAHPLIV